jgi:uncharacterized membrane protein
VIAIGKTTAKILLFIQIVMTRQESIEQAIKDVQKSANDVLTSSKDTKELTYAALNEICKTLILISKQLAELQEPKAD